MKRYFIYIGLAGLLMQSASCTKNFLEINTDPTQTSADLYNPNYLLTSAQHAFSSQGYNMFLFEGFWTQIMSSTSSLTSNYLSNGDKYVATSGTSDYQGRIWNTDYGSTDQYNTGAGNLVAEAITLTKNDPSKANLTAICMIMKAMILQQVTDVYGDVPYSQAFQGKQGVSQPAYDTQEGIYTSIFNDLTTAIGMLDASKTAVTGDLYYGGDVTKWKKFAYSLMLRAAMRLTKVSPATAQTWAEKAVAGGVFSSTADDAYINVQSTNNHDNAQARVYGTDLYQTRWSKTLIDYLKANSDPRLGVVSEVPQAGLKANKLTAAGDMTAANQLGLPNGYDLNGGPTDVTKAPNYAGSTGTGDDETPLGKYSRPLASVYTNLNAPIFVLTYAQTELLLAEAAARGWNVGGTAATHYAAGTVAGLTSLSTLGAALTISSATATAWVATHPLDITSTAASLKQINEQYWATTGIQFNYIETWFNWRRSGYPVLTPVVYDGNFSGGQIPRRQLYPVSEATLNGANYKTAVGRLSGGDNWTSRVWWDPAS
ncbi:SusD/RagB family nutrient-binding outer membrane lipoprotein [Chitinophaga sancti]|uniref:Starch-binding associating with outer membrane n=1 Tax=Chitinophaga sancti TaxID=1004 RepID=A0A1K1SS17_9BACT|nr:SusD/RagB family nutrient-binding outer membrane lipoprotein [Chitinophaga sancti]WQD65324.1 SusD/RagB family nutrient-binding outer membrane lipoprotein [Chitinophaga sancti]WQG89052.1 SusD/RagB family nutrient-binding outer membrane lipoprotein [Chitinophaga sancti]SFW86879.1 Starch-binding associating with outer membrane [Chitinophaga sancti]